LLRLKHILLTSSSGTTLKTFPSVPFLHSVSYLVLPAQEVGSMPQEYRPPSEFGTASDGLFLLRLFSVPMVPDPLHTADDFLRDLPLFPTPLGEPSLGSFDVAFSRIDARDLDLSTPPGLKSLHALFLSPIPPHPPPPPPHHPSSSQGRRDSQLSSLPPSGPGFPPFLP